MGGKSRRFGSDKAGQLVDGRSFAQIVSEAAAAAGLPVVLVGSPPASDSAPPQPTEGDPRAGTSSHTFERLIDAPDSRGPTAGLTAALERAQREGRPGVVLLACDQPGISAGAIGAIVQHATESPNAPHAFVGTTGAEPFPAYYPVGTLGVAKSAASLRAVLASAKPAMQPLDDAVRNGFAEHTWINVNTPGDLEHFLRLRAQTEEASEKP